MPASVASLIDQGKGDRQVAEALGVTRRRARAMINECLLLRAAESASRCEIDVSLCRESPSARELKPAHIEMLARSIGEVGLLQPINVRRIDDGYEVVAGLHRLHAFKLLNRETIPALIRDDNDLRAELALIDENLIRNEYSPAEKSAAIARRKAVYELLHPETKHGGAGKSRPKQSRQVGDSVPAEVERFTGATAQATGQSERTIQREAARGEALGASTLLKVARTSLDKGEELDALAKLAPGAREQLIARAESGEKVSAKVEVKKVQRAEREQKLGAKQQSLPQQKFGVILADPEWKWKPWSEAGMGRGVENTYPTSETTDIAARDVRSIAADDCVLVLWARSDMLPEALHVMTAWGFRYVAQRVWRKSRMSTGYWFRYDHELVLIGSRGKPVAPAMGTQERSVFEGEPAVPGLNSSKPECVAEWIECNWPNTPKIELNRRGPARPGWAAWGNEAEITEAQHGDADRTTPAAPSGDDPRASEQTSHVCEVGAAERPNASRPPQESKVDEDDWSGLDIPDFLKRESPDAAQRSVSSPSASVTAADDSSSAALSYSQTGAEPIASCPVAAPAEATEPCDRGSVVAHEEGEGAE